MPNDFKNSIKAKLYDFNYTPFMSSLVISWVAINHKYLLVLFSDKLDVDKKLIILNDTYSCNAVFGYFSFYFTPILFALFYVYIYPIISKKIYEYTLEQTKRLKGIKQRIEDETPLTQEEARWHRVEMEKLIQRNNSLEGSLAGEQKRYEEQTKIRIELETSKLKEENIALQGQLDDVHTYEEGLRADIRNKEKEIDFLKQELEKLKPVDTVDGDADKMENDKMKIMHYLYFSNYKTIGYNSAIDLITDKTNIKRIVVVSIVSDLILEGLLAKRDDGYLFITDKGNKKLIEMFYETKN